MTNLLNANTVLVHMRRPPPDDYCYAAPNETYKVKCLVSASCLLQSRAYSTRIREAGDRSNALHGRDLNRLVQIDSDCSHAEENCNSLHLVLLSESERYENSVLELDTMNGALHRFAWQINDIFDIEHK